MLYSARQSIAVQIEVFDLTECQTFVVGSVHKNMLLFVPQQNLFFADVN
jgi:hypothetical protein